MAHDIPSFLREIEKINQLQKIDAPVSLDLEISEIADRVIKKAGPALLFQNVKENPKVPVAIGLYGSHERLALALHDKPENIAGRITDLIGTRPPNSLVGMAKMGLQMLPTISSLGVKRGKSGPVKEVIMKGDDVDLSKIPVLKCWPDDGGPFITLPMVFTHNPNNGRRNVGMYRVQIYDKNTTGMHWQTHKVAAQHARDAAAKGQNIEAAVCLGGDPCLPFCALAPLPEEIDEMLFAGFFARQAGRTGAVRNNRRASARRLRIRDRGIFNARRTAARRPVWRSHRILHAHRAVSGFSCDVRDATP